MSQQERLLSSVIPSHLTNEIKSKMVSRVRTEPRLTRRRSAYGKFQEMYVRIHENVRYVQFTCQFVMS